MNLFDLFASKDFDKMLEAALEEEMAKPADKNEIYREITHYYSILISYLGIDSFDSFKFTDYEDPRLISVDGREYDLNREFSNEDAAEALHAVDALIADVEERLENVLKKTEKKVNTNFKR